ncbi:vacuolar polyphosphatase [Schizosaccharomyces japonicus yFS275]|uniref:Endopolyphosphatase n=1 Tax=Schizosaccharomyces japonicus (strain yFS275 / FY16936) TaxID=402676 RepID=B6JW03_SCHJY|nr:vacuolar polyphosphatase [Schizosaccharomyces japonicus yFS275]EEB05554.1 vacuolar polyphosphatase [Schizosaccharomyces japonicus yFS275]
MVRPFFNQACFFAFFVSLWNVWVAECATTESKPNLRGRFLHITDFHPDKYYSAGSSTSNYCHNHDEDLSTQKKARYLSPGPGYACDSSLALVNETLSWLSKHKDDVLGGLDFVLWTGDNSRHDNDNHFPRTRKEIAEANRDLVNWMVETFPDIPVVVSIGNNDIYPHNIMTAGPSLMIEDLEQAWEPILPEFERHIFQRGAYYVNEVIPNKLAVLSINTLYLSSKNAAVDGCPNKKHEAGTLHLRWLRVQLKLLRERGMKAYIIGHIPPTRDQWYDRCYSMFSRLMYQYRDVVISQLYGHMNVDHFAFMQYKHKHDVDVAQNERTISIRSAQPNYLVNLISNQYEALPAVPLNENDSVIDDKVKSYSVAVVGASIIPEMFPSFRVYEYNVTGTESLQSAERMTEVEDDEDCAEEDELCLLELSEDGDENGDIVDAMKKKKKKNKKKKRAVPGSPGPAYQPQPFTPTGFTQYFLNTTEYIDADESTPIEFTVLYDSRSEPYYMKDLTVPEYVRLARRIAGKASKDEEPVASLQDPEISKKKKKKKKKKRDMNALAKTYVWRAYVGSRADVLDDDFYN